MLNESCRLVVHILMKGGSSIISVLHSDVTLFVILFVVCKIKVDTKIHILNTNEFIIAIL